MGVRLRSESGMTLIELLVAMALMIIVFSATMLLFQAGANNSRLVEEHNDAQDSARRYSDRLARQLRNLASPSLLTTSTAQPLAVDLATDYDFVFRLVDEVRPAGSANAPNVKRVRYCLGTDAASSRTLFGQEQTWTTAASPPLPATTSCPGAGWTTSQVVTEDLANRSDGQSRPLFVFDSPQTARITRVRTDLFVDPTPGRRPVETRLTSGVFLRNQNRVPSASFTVVANAATNVVILNGSPSGDPEDMPLNYTWFMDGVKIGEGVVFTHAGAPDGVHTYRLEVTDPAGLVDDETMEVSL